MKQGCKVMDSDMPIIEPPDLWQCYIEPEFTDQAPRGTTKSVADLGMVGPDDTPWGRNPKNVQHLGQDRRRGHSFARNQERFQPYEDMGWTGDTQLRAMDEEGIDVAVIYPSRGLFALTVPALDPRLAAAMARAYNNWLYDFCAPDRQRLVGAGMISPFDINDAVTESRRCVHELGFRGVFLRPNIVHGRNWHDPYYEPLWSTLEALGVPIGFHEGDTAALPHVGEQCGDNTMLSHTFSHPVEQMLAAASFCGGGMLARHPTLRVAFLEGNCSWLPFFLWRLDEQWERVGDVHAPELTMAPSASWKRQCFASAEADEEPVTYTIDDLGTSNGLVFSTDFPHGDSKFPESIDRFLQLDISAEEKRQILWDTCAAYSGIAGEHGRLATAGAGRLRCRSPGVLPPLVRWTSVAHRPRRAADKHGMNGPGEARLWPAYRALPGRGLRHRPRHAVPHGERAHRDNGAGAGVSAEGEPMQTMTGSYTEEMLEVGFGTVHLMKGGEGSPLLILHDDIGSPGWLPFYAEFARRFTVYVPAHPGYGKSECPAWMRSVRDLAIAHNWLLTVLGLEALPVIGLGLGGWVAAELATMCHHRFTHLVLVGAVGVQPLEGEIADQFLVSGEEYVKRCFHNLATFEALYGKETTVDQREVWEVNREMTVRIAWKPYMFNQSLPLLLGGVDTPTLVVWGQEDTVVPRSCAQRYVESLSTARLVVLDGCGHCAEVEKPQELAVLITDFIAGARWPVNGR